MRVPEGNFSRTKLILILSGFFLKCILVTHALGSELVLEIQPTVKNGLIRLQPGDIQSIGIDERWGDIRVVVTLDPKCHLQLKEFTERNLGETVTIRAGTEVIYSAKLMAPLTTGDFAIPCSSKDQARGIISRMGR